MLCGGQWEVCSLEASSFGEFRSLAKFSLFLMTVGRKIVSAINTDAVSIATKNCRSWIVKQKRYKVGSKISDISITDFKQHIFSFWGPPNDFDFDSLTFNLGTGF